VPARMTWYISSVMHPLLQKREKIECKKFMYKEAIPLMVRIQSFPPLLFFFFSFSEELSLLLLLLLTRVHSRARADILEA
jgi:hypothetical protein